MVALSSSLLYTLDRYYLDLTLEPKREVLIIRGQVLLKHPSDSLRAFILRFKHIASSQEHVIELDLSGGFEVRLSKVGDYELHLNTTTASYMVPFKC